jgi:transcriptional regulator GlxA family with amidase domain
MAEQRIAFVLYPGFTVLDMVGPLQVFTGLRTFAPRFEPVVVAAEIAPSPTDTPLQLVPSHTLDEVPDATVVIVPGGGVPTIRAMADRRIREYLLRAAETADVVASVCTGALILGAAGLLEGRRATTHWAYHSLLERLGATYVPERWVEDGKFLTSAGVSAGIDMALHLVARLTDEPRRAWCSSVSSTIPSRRSAPSTGAPSIATRSRPCCSTMSRPNWRTNPTCSRSSSTEGRT